MTIEDLAVRLLDAIRRHGERSHEPVFAQELAAELGVTPGDAARAFQYLADRNWVRTFRIPHAGRITARGHDVLREQQHFGHSTARASAMQWDVFISHASEDKEDVALPLAERLRAEGLRVWLDRFELTVGDSLRQAIERGLAESRFGIAIISPSFLEKHWPRAELDGLAARESGGIKIILPVWHRVDAATIQAKSPMLAGRVATTTDGGIDRVVQDLLRAIQRDANATAGAPPTRVASDTPVELAKDLRRFKQTATAFHLEQTERIATGHGPIAVLDGGLLILHIMPEAAMDGAPTENFDEIASRPELFEPMRGSVQEVRISYDGMLIGSNARGLSEPQRAYVNVYRTGTVEAVVSSLANGKDMRWIELPYLQASVIMYTANYLRALNHFGVSAPFAVMVTLANASGVCLLQDFKGSAFAEDIPSALLDRDRLAFGQCVVDLVPEDDGATARYLKPILTHLANAAGLAASPYFDGDGNYSLNPRRS